MEAKSSKEELEYIVVSELESSEPIELPTNVEDNTINLQTLSRAFPNAHGLKYKNPQTGVFRALLTDATGTKFFAPANGWADKKFIVIYKSEQPKNEKTSIKGSNSEKDNNGSVKKASGKSEQNAKRRKLMVNSDDDDRDSSDSEKAERRLRQSSKQKRLDSSEEDDKNFVCADLIVLGLPFKLEEFELKEYFEHFGAVSRFEIKKKKNGTSKGFGFVKMTTLEGQIKVLAKQFHLIGGRKCQVRVPIDKNGEGRGNPLINAKVFVGRLQEKTTSSTLKTFFTEEAKKIEVDAYVIDVYIPKPFRAFAFLTLSSITVAKQLIKKSLYIIDGAQVQLQSAQPKNEVNLNEQQNSFNFNRLDMYGSEVDYYNNKNNNKNWPTYESSSGGRYREMYPPKTIPPSNQHFMNLPINSINRPPGGGLSNSGMGGGGQMLASGLDALNINPLNPELLSALNAFMSVAVTRGANQSQGGGFENSQIPNQQQHQQRSQHPASSPNVNHHFYGPNTSANSHGTINSPPNNYAPQSGRRGANSNGHSSGYSPNLQSGWRS